MGELAMIITTKAKPGRRDELFALYRRDLAPRAVDNDGQEVVVWCADEHDPDTFHLFEIYRDMAALGANAQADWFAAYLAEAGPLLAGEPTVTMAAPRWSKGVPD
ncbi:MAG: antibiotic biosynthesis monooxygenase [Actinomycetota bacterium]